jgi:hypothetical protein
MILFEQENIYILALTCLYWNILVRLFQVNSQTEAWFPRIINLCRSWSKLTKIQGFSINPSNNDYFTGIFFVIICLANCTCQVNIYYSNAVWPWHTPSVNRCTLHSLQFYYFDTYTFKLQVNNIVNLLTYTYTMNKKSTPYELIC